MYLPPGIRICKKGFIYFSYRSSFEQFQRWDDGGIFTISTISWIFRRRVFKPALLINSMGEMVSELRELSGLEVEYAKLCIQLYGMKVERFSGEGSRWFALVRDGKICAVAWIHRPHIFRPLFVRLGIDQSNTYFLRRIATCCPGDHAVELLELLAEKLRAEGKEAIVTLGLPDHSNALYRKAGFTEIARTPRTNHPVFIRKLN
ncbi:MAG: hypothetical protein QW196_05240 [Sulfolobales archaeon]